ERVVLRAFVVLLRTPVAGRPRVDPLPDDDADAVRAVLLVEEIHSFTSVQASFAMPGRLSVFLMPDRYSIARAASGLLPREARCAEVLGILQRLLFKIQNFAQRGI